MADVELPAASKAKKPKRKDEPKFGHEFKAKVSVLLLGMCGLLTGGAESRRRHQKGRGGPLRLPITFASGEGHQKGPGRHHGKR